MVTVRTDRAFTGREMGSEMARAPLGMVKEGEPPEKVTVLRVSGRMELVPEPAEEEDVTGRATVAARMGRSVAPKELLNCKRIVEASWVR